MKTIKLYAVGNENNYNYYIFDKKQKVIELLAKIFEETLEITWPLYKEPLDNSNEKRKKINFEKYKDFHEKKQGIQKRVRADIFYGDKRIFLVLHCSQKLRNKFNKKLEQISKIIKPKKPKIKTK